MKSSRRYSCVVRLTARLLVLLLLVSTAAAQQSSSPSLNQAEIVEAQDAVRQFESTSREVSEARKQLAQPHPAFVKFAAAVKAYRAAPNDNGAAASYAEAFAESVKVMKDRLTSFVSLKEQVEQDYEAFQTIAQARKDALIRQRDQTQKSAESYKSQIADWNSKLDELATRHADVIKNGGQLPEEVEQLAERADIQLAQSNMKVALFGSFAQRAEKKIAETDVRINNAKSWFHRVGLHFLNAEGNSETLDLIAAARNQEMESVLPDLGDEAIKLDPIDEPPILSDLVWSLTESLDTAATATTSSTSEVPAKPSAGSKILLRRLDKSQRGTKTSGS